jgi:hypothetical protein
MKSTTRGTLAAVITGIAAAVGAATPAAAAGTVPAPVPLENAEQSLGTELPEIGADLPLPVAGTPEGPRYVEGSILPDRTVPRVPVGSTLPGLSTRAPLPHLLGDGFDHVGVEVPASDLHALSPGLALDAPLTPPNPDNFGLPGTQPPAAGVPAPAVRAMPGANLGLGPGL